MRLSLYFDFRLKFFVPLYHFGLLVQFSYLPPHKVKTDLETKVQVGQGKYIRDTEWTVSHEAVCSTLSPVKKTDRKINALREVVQV